jgi:Protein of unknown function (DUF3102)
MNDISLDILAAQISRHFEHLEHAGPDYDDHRISVGKLLIAARGRIESGKWHNWLRANINRSIRDCQRAIALAQAPDRDRHLAHQREKNLQQVRRYRQRIRELSGGPDEAGWLCQIRDPG